MRPSISQILCAPKPASAPLHRTYQSVYPPSITNAALDVVLLSTRTILDEKAHYEDERLKLDDLILTTNVAALALYDMLKV
jgi:hypothetical protein